MFHILDIFKGLMVLCTRCSTAFPDASRQQAILERVDSSNLNLKY